MCRGPKENRRMWLVCMGTEGKSAWLNEKRLALEDPGKALLYLDFAPRIMGSGNDMISL